jgi:5-methylcytosine-specific restriction endonuclease McrA
MRNCKNCGAVLPDKQPGKLGRNPVFCTTLCGKLFRGEVRIIDKAAFCGWCNEPLVHGYRAGNPKRFCSKAHSEKLRQSLKPKKPKVEKHCDFCAKSFITNLPAARFCSADCRTEGTKQEGKAERAKLAELNPRRFDFDCDRCGKLVVTDKMVTKGSYGRYCRVCALQLRRERYRVKTARRQKVMNPVRISVDFLIERDGVICHLCQQPVDSALPRNDRMGATIDHVIPLSKGGVDELDNLKLAHWICNIRKGNKTDA